MGLLIWGRLRDNHDFLIKYKEDIGYFALDGERGVFSMRNGFPARDQEGAKFLILESEFKTGGFQYELQMRDKLEAEWLRRYNVEYDFRKAAFEYSIKMLYKVFQVIPESTVSQYTDYMNKWFQSQYWYFNKEKMLFEER